ncbi:hypothetical protein JTB14_002067 [Gonioctena quinquepunctata]|nr:hypothetical protein JTB14_002067 [Gonioctena quinquepunctata]
MVLSDSDSDILSEIDFADEDSSDYDREYFIQDMQRGESDLKFEKTSGNCNNIKFATRKKVLHNVGQVTDIEAGEIHTNRRDTLFCWKGPDDVSFIENEDVVEKLAEPAFGKRG